MKKDRNQKEYVFICYGKDCMKNGAKDIHHQLERQMKHRKRCEFIKTRCMDHCKDAPSLVIDSVRYSKVAVKDLEKILNKKAVT